MKKSYNLEIISLACSALLAFIYTFITNIQVKDDIIFGLLLAIFILVIFRLPILPILETSAERTDKKMRDFGEDLKDAISDHKVYQITHHISQLNPITKDVAQGVFRNYLERFSLERKGFSVKGEQFALNSYVLFWEKLCVEQRKNRAEGIPDIIARITHSNQIEIWCDKVNGEHYSSVTHSLYALQKEFIKTGGVIARILIGKENVPNEKYKEAMEKMKSIGVDVKYLPRNSFEVQDYDFLFLHREQLMLTWQADRNNIKLAGFAIQDTIPIEVIRDWKKLYDALEEKNDAINAIPKDREFF